MAKITSRLLGKEPSKSLKLKLFKEDRILRRFLSQGHGGLPRIFGHIEAEELERANFGRRRLQHGSKIVRHEVRN